MIERVVGNGRQVLLGMKRREILVGAAAGAALVGAHALPKTARTHTKLLERLLAGSTGRRSLEDAKLAIDALVEPSSDPAATVRHLDEMAAAIRAVLPYVPARTAPLQAKVDAVRTFLYQPGPWNGRRVYRYDLAGDPTGKKVFRNRLLSHYVRERLGNCVSMPVLFLVLAERMDLEVALATAPEHVFVKYRGDSGAYLNAETTHDGGLKRDSSYQLEFEISKLALDNGLYLRALPAREAMTVLAGTLFDDLARKRDVAGIHELADLVLAQYPQSIDAVLQKYSAYSLDLELRFRQAYPRFEDIPAARRAEATEIVQLARTWLARAEALGWRFPTDAFEERNAQLTKSAAKK